MIRLADFVVKFLEKKKITTVFTVSGGGSIFLCDALYKSKKIQYIAHHHEQAAAFAAESYARSKKDVGCCFVTTGPGGTNTITGVSSAWIDSVPVIFISGQVFYNQTIKKSGRRQVGVQEINIIDLVKPITKFSKIITDPNSINYYLEKAYTISKSGRPGPVFLDIPADVQNSLIEESKVVKRKYIEKNKNFQIKKHVRFLVKKLQISKKPLIHIGHGVRLSNGEKIIKKFFNKFNIPFILTWNADDLMPHNHKMFFGKAGAFGERGSNFIVQNCDFYLSVGTRLPFMVTGYNPDRFALKSKFKVMVDIDHKELNRKELKLDMKIKSDANLFFQILFKELKKIKVEKKWIDYCSKVKKKYPILTNEMINEKKYVNSYYFIKCISGLLKKNHTIVTDMGFSFTSSHQAMEIKKEGQVFYTNSGHAPMGWGLPAAIGAFFSKKHRITNLICLTGEGGLQMNLQELATIMHYKIPVKIFIFNNGGYLTIKQTQILGFGGRIMGADKTSGLSFPDYKKIASAHDFKYALIKNHKKLKKSISKILQLKGPVICELMMNPNEEQIPKAINRRNNSGKSIPTDLEDMYPFLSKNELKANNF
ncbi:thiamine pyrophosphate-binding protein [Candidatus Pelagibacter sp.]|nr:thiamine pyrophosphate-binding protein [Candidatus Pelagibacter sp.]